MHTVPSNGGSKQIIRAHLSSLNMKVKVVPGKLSYIHVHSFGFKPLKSEFRSSQFQIFSTFNPKLSVPGGNL